MSPFNMAVMMLQNNPKIANSPMGLQFVDILKTGNVEAGKQMAQNICASMGVSPEQAFEMAKKSFNMPL